MRGWLCVGLAGVLGAAACTQKTELFAPTSACVAPGSPVHLGGPDAAHCAASLAAAIGRRALCTCNPLFLSGGLTTRADHPGGPPGPDGSPGGVGTDGALVASGPLQIDGLLEVGGSNGVNLSRGWQLHGGVHSGGALTTQAATEVLEGAVVVGDVVGPFTIYGPLHVPDGATVSNDVVVYGKVVHGPTSVPEPCGCASGPLVDIGAAVAARQAQNDNGRLAFAGGLLADLRQSQGVDLPCGEYHLAGITTTAADLELKVSGSVGLFVGGDVRLGGDLTVTLDTDAQLDLVVGGALVSSGRLLGSSVDPARVRLWVGGTSITLADGAQLGAYVYAPAAVLTSAGTLTASGALVVGTLAAAGDVTITHITSPPAVPAGCAAPGGPQDAGVRGP